VFDPAQVGDEVFGTLRSFDYAVVLFDEDGNKTNEPTEARRFFTDKRNITVSLYEDGENSALHIYLGRSVEIESVQGLLDTLRRCATKFGILFNCRKYRRELQPKDFAHGTVLESQRKLTGSSKSSYLKLEGARLIVRHDSVIDDTKHGARSRNVKKLMVENSEGERFMMPTQNMMAGRAMTRHVSKGGTFHDEIGGKITEMAIQQDQMKTCASYCRRNKKKLDESVTEIIEACTERAKTIRHTFEGLYRRYDKTLKEMDTENLLLEDDDEMLEEKTNSLIKKLQLEDDSVVDRQTCENVVRVMEGRPKKQEMIHLPAFDCDVEKSAWEGFLKDTPVVNFIGGVAPDVSPAGDNLSAGLSLVAKRCADDAFSNLLARAAQMLENGTGDMLTKHIATRAIAAAKAHPEKANAEPLVKTPSKDMERVPESKTPKNDLIMTESVRAFEAWFDKFDENKIFESYYADYEDGDASYSAAMEAALDKVEEEFSADDFLVMYGSDFGFGDAEAVAEDKVFDVTDIMSSLNHYLENAVEKEMLRDDEYWSSDASSISNLSKEVIDQVISKLEEDGFTITGKETLEDSDDEELSVDADDGDEIKFDDRMLEKDEEEDVESDGLDADKDILLGGEDLSAEDVVMPTDPAKDLKKDIAADTDDKDADYINRLLSLAGRKTQMSPKAPQP
jgi:hypothetical protein